MTNDEARNDWWAALLAIVVFVVLSLIASRTSEGFLEADGCTHFLYAKFAIDEPHYLVNIWGRPLCTALYALPARWGGLQGVRMMSLSLAVGCALVAHWIARNAKLPRPIPVLALIFTLAQPLVFLHSFSELTELPFALLLGLAFVAFQRARWLYFALLVSILPLARPEGFGILALSVIVLLARRRWIELTIILPLPLLLWSYAGWTIYGSPPEYPWWKWLPRNWPYAEKSAYRSGSILHFVMLMPAVVSPLMLPATFVGVWRAMRAKSFATILIAAIPISILAGHSVLYATGRMASSGEVRYMLVIAPFWGALGAIGWYAFFAQRRRRHALMWALIAAVLPIYVNARYRVVPVMFEEDWVHARVAADWWKSTALARDYPMLTTAHPGVFYFGEMSPTEKSRVVEWTLANVQRPRDGTIMIWDKIYGVFNADTSRSVHLEDALAAGWLPIRVPRATAKLRDNEWIVLLSPRDAARTAIATEFGEAQAVLDFPWRR